MDNPTHGYIVGQTRSGKTHLARALVRSILRTGRPALVYDPTANKPQSLASSNWPPGALVCRDWPDFSRIYWQSRGLFVIIDEAPEAFADNRSDARAMILRGRHLGHVAYMLAQRHILMDRSARTQANHLFAFTVDIKDSAELALEWNCPALEKCYLLPQFHFIELIRHGHPRQAKL